MRGDAGAVGGEDAVVEAPLLETLDAVGLDVVGGHDVAGEGGAVYGEHAVAVPGEEHGERGAGAACAYDDDVVHGASELIGVSRDPTRVAYTDV